MYGYVYITENLINNKKYIGQHKSDVFDMNYKGSGKILKRAFKKYGKENFKTSILEKCNTQKELDEKEIYWITYYNADQSDDFYNICKGGSTGRAMQGKNNPMFGKHHSDITKKKISQKNLGKKRTQEWIDEYRKKHPNWNSHPHSEEFKKRISQRMMGSKNPMYGTHNGTHIVTEDMKEEKRNFMTKYWQEHQHPMLNTKRSEETKEKISCYRKDNGVAKGGKNPRARKVYCVEIDLSFDCLTDAANYLGIKRTTLSAHMGEKYNGYTVVYV